MKHQLIEKPQKMLPQDRRAYNWYTISDSSPMPAASTLIGAHSTSSGCNTQ